MLSAGGNFGASRRELWSDAVDGAEPDYSVDPFAEAADAKRAMDVDYEPLMGSAVIAQGTSCDAGSAGGLAGIEDGPSGKAQSSAAIGSHRTPSKHAQASSYGTPVRGAGRETDEHRLAMRQKQIDYGKNTEGYRRYRTQVPRHRRVHGRHPQTPQKDQLCSKRSWDGQMSKWRRALHAYDDPAACPPNRAMTDS